MPQKPADLPMQAAIVAAKDMRAYFAEPSAIKRDEIAARQASLLVQHRPPRQCKLRVADVKEMFREMKDRA
jgi:hypothetical protein